MTWLCRWWLRREIREAVRVAGPDTAAVLGWLMGAADLPEDEVERFAKQLSVVEKQVEPLRIGNRRYRVATAKEANGYTFLVHDTEGRERAFGWTQGTRKEAIKEAKACLRPEKQP